MTEKPYKDSAPGAKRADAPGKGTCHFSRLTEAEQERLSILIEECGEVVQSACKILRHGYESTNPKVPNSETNRQGLEREIGDLLHAATRMEDSGDLDPVHITERKHSKPAHILPYLHHQPVPETLPGPPPIWIRSVPDTTPTEPEAGTGSQGEHL